MALVCADSLKVDQNSTDSVHSRDHDSPDAGVDAAPGAEREGLELDRSCDGNRKSRARLAVGREMHN